MKENEIQDILKDVDKLKKLAQKIEDNLKQKIYNSELIIDKHGTTKQPLEKAKNRKGKILLGK